MINKVAVSILLISSQLLSQSTDSSKSFRSLFSNRAQVKSAIEVESLFPMFFYGGYHAAIGYRFSQFRIRVSVIKGGNYNVEPNGIDNEKNSFNRYYSKPGYGIFLGYNILQNWDVYTYIERHTFGIERIATSEQIDLHSTDFGLGTSYQLFIGKWFYLQPGLHVYIRGSQTAVFSDGAVYSIPNVDISPVIRAGVRLWHLD